MYNPGTIKKTLKSKIEDPTCRCAYYRYSACPSEYLYLECSLYRRAEIRERHSSLVTARCWSREVVFVCLLPAAPAAVIMRQGYKDVIEMRAWVSQMTHVAHDHVQPDSDWANLRVLRVCMWVRVYRMRTVYGTRTYTKPHVGHSLQIRLLQFHCANVQSWEIPESRLPRQDG